MCAEKFAEPSEMLVEGQRCPQMQPRRPVRPRAPRHSVLHRRRSRSPETPQRLRAAEEKQIVDRQRFHDARVLVDLAQSAAKLHRHAPEQRHIHLHVGFALGGAVLRQPIADDLR